MLVFVLLDSTVLGIFIGRGFAAEVFRWVSDLFDSGCEGPSGKEADAMGPSMAAVPWWLVIVLVVVVGVLAVIRQVTRSGKGR